MIHTAIGLAMKLMARNKLSILIYHQVFAEFDPMRPNEPTAEVFDWQMALLKEHFTPISLNDAVEGLKNNTLPPNAVCVTFDDGYLNNLEVATPILKRHQVPATVYVATGFTDGNNMWNDNVIDLCANQEIASFELSSVDMGRVEVSGWEQRKSLAGQLIDKLKYLEFEQRLEKIANLYEVNGAKANASKMMNEHQLVALAEEGVDIGAHTVDHPILTTLSADRQYEQMYNSKSRLESILGKKVSGFAYPNGKIGKDYNEVSVEQVTKLGFDYALTTNWGVNTTGSSQYELNRFTPWDNSKVAFHTRLFRNAI